MMRGTEGSNPAPSSGESSANRTSSNMPRKNTSVDSRAGAAVARSSILRWSPAIPSRSTNIAGRQWAMEVLRIVRLASAAVSNLHQLDGRDPHQLSPAHDMPAEARPTSIHVTLTPRMVKATGWYWPLL
jgi:hypothetical protein